MNIATTAVSPSARRAVQEAVFFVQGHARALCDLFEALDDNEGLDALVDAIGLCDRPDSEAKATATATALAKILAALSGASFQDIEDAAGTGLGPRDLHAAVRWYGARVADLLSRFRQL